MNSCTPSSVSFSHSPFFPPRQTDDPEQALRWVREIYEQGTDYLRQSFSLYLQGAVPQTRVRACYPCVRLKTETEARPDSRLSYGFVDGAGVFETTLTRPDLYENYLRQQFQELIRNHAVPLEVATSKEPIPLPFAFREGESFDHGMCPERRAFLRDYFDLPELSHMGDAIANGTWHGQPGEPRPLSLFKAARTDYSLQRLRHYTGSSAEHFQNFILLTNYQFYVDEFVRLGKDRLLQGTGDVAFVEPGGKVTRAVDGAWVEEGSEPPRTPQMAAYHLVRPDRSGITLVNIGVGPANAKTMTDHLAVLRPHVWLMLGHCAGLRNSQALGDYVLAHGYVREDHVLDEDLPPWVPVPPLAEVQMALEAAVAEITQLKGFELKKVMRTGTVASTDNRNWELLPAMGGGSTPQQRFSQSRAIALDMESATVAANGLRFRVPYGTLLCVSDKPLHGEIKLPGMADQFYRARVDQHLQIGVLALELLRSQGLGSLHSRKLRSFSEVAFQ